MTLKEFLAFISKDGAHFIGFLICCGLFISLVKVTLNGIANIARASFHKEPRKKKNEKTELSQ